MDRVEDRLGYVLKRAQQALGVRMAAALAALGLTNAQYAALSALDADPGLSNAELARRSFVTPQTMNQVVALLERNGLVARHPHPVHGRILQAHLTEAGAAALAAGHRAVLPIEQRLAEGLDTTEQAQLLAWLRRCADSMTSPLNDDEAAARPPR